MPENVSLTLKSHSYALTLQTAGVSQIQGGTFPYTFPITLSAVPTVLKLKQYSAQLTLQTHTPALTLKPMAYNLTLSGAN